MDSVHLVDWDKTLAGLRLMLAAAGDGMDALLDGGRWVEVQVGLLVIEVAKLANDREDWFPLGKWATIQSMQAACEKQLKTLFANAAGQARAVASRPEPACSPLPPCALCGRTEYPVEYGPRQNKLPAGSMVGFDNGEQVWICRRCSRDTAALERLETDASLTANAGGQIPPASGGNLDRLVGHSV